MEKISTFLWFDKEAVEAANFYTSIFPNSKITNINKITGTPSGDCDIVSFKIFNDPFQAISAGPYFKFNSSISFMINFDPSQDNDAKKNLDKIWEKLIDGGKALMEIGEYPWSKRYGWVEDKFGVSWQLILTNPDGEKRPQIIPSLLFVGDIYGRAEEASNFYLSIFKNSERGILLHYGPNQIPNKEGTVMFTDFKLENKWFTAMDGGGEHHFKFNEAISFIIDCKDQEETDYFWEKLSEGGEQGQCGWLKDKFGVSWQVTPRALNELMSKDKTGKVTQAMLKMNKIIIADLEKASK